LKKVSKVINFENELGQDIVRVKQIQT